MLPHQGTSHDSPNRQRASEPTSWGRAIAVSVLTVLLLVLAFFYVPQWLLTLPAGLPRGIRVWLATGWTAVAFAGACYAAWWYTGPPASPVAGGTVRTGDGS